jgi:hypothetical protein
MKQNINCFVQTIADLIVFEVDDESIRFLLETHLSYCNLLAKPSHRKALM